jgi:hypothetical protein
MQCCNHHIRQIMWRACNWTIYTGFCSCVLCLCTVQEPRVQVLRWAVLREIGVLTLKGLNRSVLAREGVSKVLATGCSCKFY